MKEILTAITTVIIKGLLLRGVLSQTEYYDVVPTNQAWTVDGEHDDEILLCGLKSDAEFANWYRDSTYLFRDRDPRPGIEDLYELEDTISSTFENYNLRMLTMTTEKAGVYRCNCLTGSDDYSVYAEVVVLDGHPTCCQDLDPEAVGDYKEGDVLQYSCTVTYVGTATFIPRHEWIAITGPDPPTSNDVHDEGTGTATSTFELTGDRSHDGAQYPCVTTFVKNPERPDPPEHYSTNIPDYDNTCSTPVLLNIKYPVENIRIVEISGDPPYIMDVGDSLTCQADGNPAPTYTWFVNDTDVGSGNPLILTENLPGTSSFLCRATNIIRGDTNTKETPAYNITVEDSTACNCDCSGDSSGLGVGDIAAIILGVLLLFSVVIIITLLVKLQRATVKEKTHSPPFGQSGLAAGRFDDNIHQEQMTNSHISPHSDESQTTTISSDMYQGIDPGTRIPPVYTNVQGDPYTRLPQGRLAKKPYEEIGS